jgi:CRP-like cAMP-binding protein
VLEEWREEVSCPARSLDLVERMILLRKAPAFHGAGLDSLAELARQMVEERVEAGERLFAAGEVGRRIRLVVCGVVECTDPDSGRSFLVGPGFPLGSIEAYAGEARWYDAVAREHVVTLCTSVEVLIDLMEDHLDMALSFLAAISSRILRLGEQLAASRRDDPPPPE